MRSSLFLATAAALLSSKTVDAQNFLCTSQGAGSCNLSLIGIYTDEISGTLFEWQSLGIFNNACVEIGGVSRPWQGEAVDSQLPYTVVLEYLPSGYNVGDPTVIGMCYAGYCYTGNFACNVYGSYLFCEHGFPC
ncbi:hypothetical protein BX600DRAFT_514660 [Xylariales sp. PMI_506]|nr:hypothetical protein BX600DRAFT_514660 [Xylariales sp. PMI_506]